MGKIFLGIASFCLLIFLVVWLWQRQPSGPTQEIPTQKTEQKSGQAQNSQAATAKPQDNLVVASQNIKIKGKLNPNDYLIIASNTFAKIVKTDETGDFEVEVTLQKGLNLLDYTSISSDLKTINKNSLTYYFSPDKKYKSVFAGVVKSIFDTLLTITTPSGEVNARTSRSTQIEIPQSEDDSQDEATNTALRNIRVGDFAISLGENSAQNTQVSENLTIIRQNKPQNNTALLTAQIATAPKQNNFTAKNLVDSKVLELTTTKETIVQEDEQAPAASPSPKATPKTPSPTSQITKDKNAIIIYHEEAGKNIVDLIYMLP